LLIGFPKQGLVDLGVRQPFALEFATLALDVFRSLTVPRTGDLHSNAPLAAAAHRVFAGPCKHAIGPTPDSRLYVRLVGVIQGSNAGQCLTMFENLEQEVKTIFT